MQTVYILRDNGEQLALFLPLSELHMDDIGLCVRIEHAMAIKIKENIGMTEIKRMGNDGFGGIGIMLTIKPVLAAKIRNAAFR